MIKNLLCMAALMTTLHVTAQESPLYVAAKTGLNIRETPDVNAKVLDKIPYGTKVTLHQTDEAAKKINTEGLDGYWRKVTYNSKTGYIISSYLFPFAPPKAGIKSIKEYLAQLSSTFGSKLVAKHGDEETGYSVTKQLYQNGGEWHELIGYEYSSMTYFIPEFTIEQGFLLIRLIEEFGEVISAKDEFPARNKTYKKGENQYTVKVEKEPMGDIAWINSISIEMEAGVIHTLKIYKIDTELVIYYGSGV